MNLPDDQLFWIAVLVLCLGVVYEIWKTAVELGAKLRWAIVSLRQRIAARMARPVSTPALLVIPVTDSAVPARVSVPTNYLETMSPEEMDRFLSEPGA